MAVETRTAQTWIDDDNVIHVVVRLDAAIVLEDAVEHMDVGRELAQGRAYTMLLLDITGMRSISRDARVFYSRGDRTVGQVTNRAIAMLVRSPLARAIANFFIGLNRPRTPLRLFTSEQEALTWLRTFAD